MKFSRIALLSAATLAVAQPHNHAHKHAARHGSPLEGRDAATTTTVPGPIVTVYELNGQFLQWDEVEAGIRSGRYILTGDKITSVLTPTTSSTSTSTTPTSTSTSSLKPTTTSSPAAKFLEQKTSTSSTPTSTYVAPTTSSKPAPTSSAASSPAEAASDNSASSSSSSGATGIDAEFPDNEISCGDFVSLTKYGAVSAEYLGLDGFIGVQKTPSYSPGEAAISYIETAIAGGNGPACVANSFCSYMCPAGYQKAQFPTAQGSTGQSIGGLYCNSNGKLELTRTGYKTLCQKGVGNIQAKSDINKVVAICRTDYPGTESETVGVEVGPGSSVPITCPDAGTYYKWQGSFTTAQYYINPSGYGRKDACLWSKPGSNIGNYAPLNMGLGRNTAGEIFMSLFPNKPSNPDGVLDFNVKIVGSVSGTCSYVDGQFYLNGAASATGCTVSVSGPATLEFY